MEKIVQMNSLTHRQEDVTVPETRAITLDRWVEKLNQDAPAHIEYVVKREEEK